MKPFIRIIRHPYEEPFTLNLVVTASNGRQCGEIEIYTNASDLREFADKLRGFPKADDDTAIWELGSERPSDRFAFYFRLRVIQIRTTGQCAIEFRFCNNQSTPIRELGEFSIDAMPADIDRLMALVARFADLQHEVLVWSVTDGKLYEVNDSSLDES